MIFDPIHVPCQRDSKICFGLNGCGTKIRRPEDLTFTYITTSFGVSKIIKEYHRDPLIMSMVLIKMKF